MDRIDRLTALMERFTLSIRPAPLAEAGLVVTAGADRAPRTVRLAAPGAFSRQGGGRAGAGGRGARAGGERADRERPDRDSLDRVELDRVGLDRVELDGERLDGERLDGERVLFSAAVDWGGAANPLLAALPPTAALDLRADPESAGLIGLMLSEAAAGRCGVASVVSRLGEVLVVRLLRAQIEAGAARPGLLAGLADPRLSRAIVAMHERPGRPWRNADLAREAGLSLSRFAELFPAAVGETPAAYLRRWRLTLARQDALRGDRVDAIARRYGFASPEGFARAFRGRYGENPVALRRPAR